MLEGGLRSDSKSESELQNPHQHTAKDMLFYVGDAVTVFDYMRAIVSECIYSNIDCPSHTSHFCSLYRHRA